MNKNAITQSMRLGIVGFQLHTSNGLPYQENLRFIKEQHPEVDLDEEEYLLAFSIMMTYHAMRSRESARKKFRYVAKEDKE